jgi:hypothetical protein
MAPKAKQPADDPQLKREVKQEVKEAAADAKSGDHILPHPADQLHVRDRRPE